MGVGLLRSVRHAAVGLLGLFCLAAVACESKKAPPPDQSAPASVLPLVAEPAGMLFQLRLEQPKKLWSGLRSDLGAKAAFFSSSVGGLLSNTLQLPIAIAQEVDEALPAFVAVAKGPKGPLVAFAIHVKDAGRFRNILKASNPQRFRIERKGTTAYLRKKDVATVSSQLSLALMGNYLLAANRDEAVTHLGSYLTRNLARAKPTPYLVHGTSSPAAPGELKPYLVRWLRPRLEQMPSMFQWFLRPSAVVAWFETASTSLAAGEWTLRRDAFAFELEIRAKATQAAKAALAKLPQSAFGNVQTLPDDTMAALSWVETQAGRGRDRDRLIKKLAAGLGGQASSKTAAAADFTDKLKDALSRMAEGRAHASMIGARCTGVGVTGFAKGEVRDKQALKRGASGLGRLLDHPLMRQQLVHVGVDIKRSKGRLERVPLDVFRLRISRRSKKDDKKGDPEPIDVRYAIGDASYQIAAGHETVPTLQWLFKPPAKEQTLAGVERVLRALKAAPAEGWFSGFVDLQAVRGCAQGKPMSHEPAPLMVSIGMAEQSVRLWLRVDRRLLEAVAAGGYPLP